MQNLITLFHNEHVTTLIQWLLMVNIIDVLTGFIKAIDNKNVSSQIMKHGALSKIIIWVVVLVSGIISSYFNTDITSYVIGYYLIMEIVSIFENATQFISVPEKLKDFLNVNNNETDDVISTSDLKPNDEILKFIKEKENEYEWCNF